MKVITKDQEVIKVDELTPQYVLVAVDANKRPLIFTLRDYHDESSGCLLCISNGLSEGNGFDDISDVDDFMIRHPSFRFEAFHQDEWKEAMTWLIENGK